MKTQEKIQKSSLTDKKIGKIIETIANTDLMSIVNNDLKKLYVNPG